MNDYVRDRMMTDEETEACASSRHGDCPGFSYWLEDQYKEPTKLVCKCYHHSIDRLTPQLGDIADMLAETLVRDSRIATGRLSSSEPNLSNKIGER